MVSIKIACCKQTMEDFYNSNKEFIVDTNINFNCDCVIYGSHRIYFCLCAKCWQDLQKGKNLHAVNGCWMKSCPHELNLKSLLLNETMRFFRYWDIELPIHWYNRVNAF